VSAEQSLEVIIAVRNGQALLADCLTSVVPQLRPGDRVTVVDDGSSDQTAELAEELGAVVVRNATSRGPYPSRQAVAMASERAGLIFFDMRSRALPGWLEAHRGMLSEAGTALSATDVRVLGGPSMAERISALQQAFRLSIYVDGPRTPYFPTCNLGVQRSAFVAVGGFSDVRSGADADLCWRIQHTGLGRLATRPDTLVEWQPRSSLSAVFEQSYRYGRGHRALTAEYRTAADTTEGKVVAKRRRNSYVRGLIRQGARPTDLAMLAVLRGVFWAGVLRGPSRSVDSAAPPTPLP
jgi:glycosyltransferase involved in cell wall biosynthesis